MLRTFTDLVNETVNEAYENGINLFLETLETDLEKDLYINEHGLAETLEESLQVGFDPNTEIVNDGVTNIE